MNTGFPSQELPPPPPQPHAARARGRLRLAGVGLAIAVVGATAGFVVTRAAAPAAANTTAAASTPKSSPSAHRPSFGPRGGFGAACGAPFAGGGFGGPSAFGGGFLGGGLCGGETGTVTRIAGSTLTLRTITGSVTVTTNASTIYSREDQKVKFSAVTVGDVVAVRGSRGASPTATSPIAATAITIEVASISGRVQSVSGDIVTLVTGDGQLEYVTVSSATIYRGTRGATASSSSLKAGIYVVAQGTQVSLTTLSADEVQVLGTLSFVPHSFPGHAGSAPMPAQPGSATTSV
jgi:hypothetical protein